MFEGLAMVGTVDEVRVLVGVLVTFA